MMHWAYMDLLPASLWHSCFDRLVLEVTGPVKVSAVGLSLLSLFDTVLGHSQLRVSHCRQVYASVLV